MNKHIILTDDGKKMVLILDDDNVLVEIRPLNDEELKELDDKSPL